MANQTEKHSNYITGLRTHVEQFLETFEQMTADRAEFASLDYGNQLTDDDFFGDNEHMTVADLTAALSSYDAILSLLQSGHFTNLYKVKA